MEDAKAALGAVSSPAPGSSSLPAAGPPAPVPAYAGPTVAVPSAPTPRSVSASASLMALATVASDSSDGGSVEASPRGKASTAFPSAAAGAPALPAPSAATMPAASAPAMHAAAPQMQAAVPQMQAAVPQMQAAVPQMQAAMPQMQAAMPQMQAAGPQAGAAGMVPTMSSAMATPMGMPGMYMTGAGMQVAQTPMMQMGAPQQYAQAMPQPLSHAACSMCRTVNAVPAGGWAAMPCRNCGALLDLQALQAQLNAGNQQRMMMYGMMNPYGMQQAAYPFQQMAMPGQMPMQMQMQTAPAPAGAGSADAERAAGALAGMHAPASGWNAAAAAGFGASKAGLSTASHGVKTKPKRSRASKPPVVQPPPEKRYTGVVVTRSGRWRARLRNGRRTVLHLGMFDTAVEAAEAVDLKAIELRGNTVNFPMTRYLQRMQGKGGLAALKNNLAAATAAAAAKAAAAKSSTSAPAPKSPATLSAPSISNVIRIRKPSTKDMAAAALLAGVASGSSAGPIADKASLSNSNGRAPGDASETASSVSSGSVISSVDETPLSATVRKPSWNDDAPAGKRARMETVVSTN